MPINNMYKDGRMDRQTYIYICTYIDIDDMYSRQVQRSVDRYSQKKTHTRVFVWFGSCLALNYINQKNIILIEFRYTINTHTQFLSICPKTNNAHRNSRNMSSICPRSPVCLSPGTAARVSHQLSEEVGNCGKTWSKFGEKAMQRLQSGAQIGKLAHNSNNYGYTMVYGTYCILLLQLIGLINQFITKGPTLWDKPLNGDSYSPGSLTRYDLWIDAQSKYPFFRDKLRLMLRSLQLFNNQFSVFF